MLQITELLDTEKTIEQAEQIAMKLFTYFYTQRQSVQTNLSKENLLLLLEKLQNLSDRCRKLGHELIAVKILFLATQLQNQYDDTNFEEIQKNALCLLILTCKNILEKQEASQDDVLLCTDIVAKAISNVSMPEDEQTMQNRGILALHRFMYFVRNFEKKSYELNKQSLLCCETLYPHFIEMEVLIKLAEFRKNTCNGDQNALLSCDEQAIVFIDESSTEEKYKPLVKEFNESLSMQCCKVIRKLLPIQTESALGKALNILFILHEKFIKQRLSLKHNIDFDSSDKPLEPNPENVEPRECFFFRSRSNFLRNN